MEPIENCDTCGPRARRLMHTPHRVTVDDVRRWLAGGVRWEQPITRRELHDLYEATTPREVLMPTAPQLAAAVLVLGVDARVVGGVRYYYPGYLPAAEQYARLSKHVCVHD
jgi:hypothetical protein